MTVHGSVGEDLMWGIKSHGMVESGHERQEVLEGVELTEVGLSQSAIAALH